MLQWPGDCELSHTISSDGALVPAQTCSTDRALPATACFPTGQKHVDQSARMAQGVLGGSKPNCTVIQYLPVGEGTL